MTEKPIPRIKRVRRGSPEDQERLRMQILEAARQIYRREGLPGLTMRAVGAEVGVSAMALYRYFADKSELIHGLWDFVMVDVHDMVRVAVEQAAQAGAGPRGQLRACTDSAITYWETHPDHFRLVFMTEQTTGPRRLPGITGLASYHRVIDLAKGLIETLADELGTGRSRCALARDLRMTMIVGYLHARIVNQRYPWSDLAALRGQMVDRIVEAVVACLREGQPSSLRHAS